MMPHSVYILKYAKHADRYDRQHKWGFNMNKFTITAIVATAVMAAPAFGPAFGQVSDDINVDLTVTAQPQITITPPADVSFSSDGTNSTPGQAFATTCFETSLSDIRITVAKLNAINNNMPSLVNSSVGDYVNYNLAGAVGGAGGLLLFNTDDVRDYDLTSATTGAAGCGASEFFFNLALTPQTDPQFPSRAISEMVAASGIDDGTPYVFSDVLTVTFEPTL